MSSYYPPGYNGTDGPSTTVVLRCRNGHYWQTTMHRELGQVTIENDECPRCPEWGEITDLDYVPSDDEEDDE